jgi:hypothetical protein
MPARGAAFALVAAAFAAYAFVPSGLAAHMLAIFGRLGLDAGTVVTIGALFGPAQVTARLAEFALIRNLHPLWMVRFAVGLLLLPSCCSRPSGCRSQWRRPSPSCSAAPTGS